MAKTPARASSAKTKKGMGQFVAAKTAPAAPKPKPEPLAAPERRSKRIFEERKPLMTRLSAEQHKRLRQAALDANVTVQDLVVKALSAYLVENGMDPL